jgi:sugar/nucleoside kinase (ribokinase family)
VSGGVHTAGAPPEAGLPREGILRLPPATRPRYEALIGTGGIGAGTFFLLDGDHTLGREESRSGRFLDRRDYCKLHIVCHYIKELLGPRFFVLPIGLLGDDEEGRTLHREMEEVGLDLRRVQTLPGRRTLFSFCFLYPDGTGGNLTTSDSACSAVDAVTIEVAASDFADWRGRGIALAVPEVPLPARLRLLELAGDHGFLRAASFTLGEMPAVREDGLLRYVDLLAVNLEEALAAAGLPAVGREAADPAAQAAAAIAALSRRHPALRLSITAGAHGSWCWDSTVMSHSPALPVRVETTGGAGDAHFAGILAGLAAGLPLIEAQLLGTLLASASVTSPHTIHKGITRGMLRGMEERTTGDWGAVLNLLTG